MCCFPDIRCHPQHSLPCAECPHGPSQSSAAAFGSPRALGELNGPLRPEPGIGGERTKERINMLRVEEGKGMNEKERQE